MATDEETTELELREYLKKHKKVKPEILNEEKLTEKVNDIILRMPSGDIPPWDETLVLTATSGTTVDNIQDDIQRELAFYTQTVGLVDKAYEMCHEFDIKWKRPDDYFAEMIKSDEHMLKIKSKLMTEKKRISSLEEKKRQKEFKKSSKKAEAEKQQDKKKGIQQQQQKISKWRKAMAKGGNEDLTFGDDDTPLPAGNPNDVSKVIGKKKSTKSVPVNKRNKKREYKNMKYGHGGKREPKNSLEPLKRKRVQMKQKRPGKRTRQQQKQKR